ncbi:MAG: LUD domain-containing protein [Solirubrobacteraceae bacterium]
MDEASPPVPLEGRAAEPRPGLDLVDEWRARWEELDGRAHRTGSLEEACALAREIIGPATVARWEDARLEGIAEAEAPASEAEVSLLVADVAVADTGQVGWAHGAGRPRGAGVLPSRQVILLAQDAVVASLADALTLLGASATAPPSSLVLIAGPSRTADIEQRVIRGVHAPREIDVIVYRGPG